MSARFALPLALLATFVAVPASAGQAGAPAPGCAGVAATDPEGDVAHGGGPNYDVKDLWFSFDGSKAFAHTRVADLSKAVSKPGLAVRWFVVFRVGDGFHYVRAFSDGTEVNYKHGTYDPTLDDFTGVGDVKGAMVEGPNGVISVEIPKSVFVKPGNTIAEPFVTVRESGESGAPANQSVYLPQSDRAPDTGAARDFVVAACPGTTGGTPAPAAPVVSAPLTPPPAVLGVKARSSAGSANKASRRRAVTIRLSGTATALRADLLKGSRIVGSGSLKRLAGNGKLTLKLKRRIAAGTYGLRLRGKVADGRQAEAILRIRFSR